MQLKYNEKRISLDQKILYDKVIEKLYDSLEKHITNIDYLKERALEFAKRKI